MQNVKVKATKQTQDGGWQLDTNQGTIQAKRIVNAAGLNAFDLVIKRTNLE